MDQELLDREKVMLECMGENDPNIKHERSQMNDNLTDQKLLDREKTMECIKEKTYNGSDARRARLNAHIVRMQKKLRQISQGLEVCHERLQDLQRMDT